ncbi:MAG: hypothetical protein R2724_16535 [Bryobacterales bacterium]
MGEEDGGRRLALADADDQVAAIVNLDGGRVATRDERADAVADGLLGPLDWTRNGSSITPERSPRWGSGGTGGLGVRSS